MTRLQSLTGMRAGEVMAMRGVALNTSGPVWVYTPRHHKNRHRGLDRIIHLGPKAQPLANRVESAAAARHLSPADTR